jgi:AraC-like DNA-binding protein
MIEGIYLMGILQGVILIGIVFSKSHFRTGNSLFLSMLILISSLLILGQLLINTDVHSRWPILFLFITGLPFIVGPYLYFYATSKIQSIGRPWLIILHHLPFLVYVGFLVIILIQDFSGDLEKFISASTLSKGSQERGNDISIGLIKAFHLLIYTMVSFVFLYRNDSRKVKWLHNILLVFIIGQVVFWIFIILQKPFVDDTFILFQVVFLFLIGYQGILNKDAIVEREKYESSKLENGKIQLIFNGIKEKIVSDQLYLNQDFSLKNLSELVELTEHQTSQVINQVTGQNFSILINNYRVEKVKELMQNSNYDHLKLLSIAFEAGFSNKNSFNQHFKRVTGMTPSSYKGQIGQ